MLERATGCFETAGRRFLREPSGTTQARRCLSQHFWKHNIGGDASHLLSALTQPPDQSSSLAQRPSRRSQASNEANVPFLDFLYPRRAQDLTTARLSRLSKRVGLRRRKRAPAGLRRTYVSEAVHASRPQNDGQQDVSQTNDTQLNSTPAADDTHETVRPVEAINKLLAHLKAPVKNATSFEVAWVIFLSAGRPPEALSEALAYFSRSNLPINQDRAWEIFLSMEDRSEADFRSIMHSQFQKTTERTEPEPQKLIQICKLAKRHRRSRVTFATCFMHFMNIYDWNNARHVWVHHSKLNARTKEEEDIIPVTKETRIAPEAILRLMTYINDEVESKIRPRWLMKFSVFLLARLSTSLWMLKDPPMDTVSSIIQKSHALGIMTHNHYEDIIHTLQSATIRSDFARSIVFYRQMLSRYPKLVRVGRWHRNLLPRQLDRIVHFGMTSHVAYFLDEISRFYGKPSIQSYKIALNTFAKSGDVHLVYSVLERLVADHGNPQSCKLLTPLLLVHANTGNVSETLNQFQRFEKEFQVKPNVACWNIVLTAYVNANDLAGVFSQFSKMVENGIEPDSYTFGILMGICANRGDVPAVRRLLQQAEEMQQPITMPMLGTVAQAYMCSGRVDLAEELAMKCLKMKVEGSPMRMWNSILMQHAFRIDHGAFKRSCRRMEEAGLEPDEMTHAADLLRLALIGSADMARSTLRRLHKQGVVHATVVHYTIVLLAYIKVRNLPMALEILKEAVLRFPESGLASSLKKFEAEIAPDLDAAQENGVDLTAEERLKKVEILLIESIANRSVAALASSIFPDGYRVGIANSVSSWSHEYLIRQYGANGAIELARGLFDKQLGDAQADNQDDGGSVTTPAPGGLVCAIMTAHLNAKQFKEVDECWKLAVESAIKESSRLNIEHRVEQHLKLQTSFTQRASQSLDETEVEIMPARRFALSRPLSIYIRSLAARNEPERIAEVVADVEKIGFELSGFNWTVLVRMLAESDKFELVAEAFRVHEKRFMPNWPGWNRLQSGQFFKPPGTPRGTYLLESPGVPEQSKHWLGRKAVKYWSNMAPDFLQPSYLTVVCLASALDRMRKLSVFRGGSELDKLFKIAPLTVEAISKMPYLRDKFQGTLIRERSEAPEKEPQGRRENKVAGILGPGAVPRRKKASYVQFYDDGNVQEGPQSSLGPTNDPMQDDANDGAQKKKDTKASFKSHHYQIGADAMAEEWQDYLTPEELFDFQAQSRYDRMKPRSSPHKPMKPVKSTFSTSPEVRNSWYTPPKREGSPHKPMKPAKSTFSASPKVRNSWYSAPKREGAKPPRTESSTRREVSPAKENQRKHKKF